MGRRNIRLRLWRSEVEKAAQLPQSSRQTPPPTPHIPHPALSRSSCVWQLAEVAVIRSDSEPPASGPLLKGSVLQKNEQGSVRIRMARPFCEMTVLILKLQRSGRHFEKSNHEMMLFLFHLGWNWTKKTRHPRVTPKSSTKIVRLLILMNSLETHPIAPVLSTKKRADSVAPLCHCYFSGVCNSTSS